MLTSNFLTPFRRRVAAAGLVSGVVAFTAAELLSSSGEAVDAAGMLSGMQEHRATIVPAALMGVAASLLLIVGLFGLLSRRTQRGGALLNAGLALSLYGLVANCVLAGVSVMFSEIADPARDRAEMTQLLDGLTHNAAALPILAGHYTMALGLLLLGIGLWRAGVGPRWAAVAVALWPLLDFAVSSAGVDEAIAAIVSNASALIGLGAYAWVVLREPAADASDTRAARIAVGADGAQR